MLHIKYNLITKQNVGKLSQVPIWETEFEIIAQAVNINF